APPAAFHAADPRTNLHIGGDPFGQPDTQLLQLIAPPPGGLTATRSSDSGRLVSFFLDDKFSVAPWLTLSAGIRPTHFSGGVSESAINPRFGVSLVVPRLKWIFRGFYGHYYQAPPLLTASGPLLPFLNQNNLNFIPLFGERDEEHQFGV